MAALVGIIFDRVLSSCEEDPKLRSYISVLRERMNKLMETVTGRGGKTGKPSKEDSIIKISEFLAVSSQDVVNIIKESKYDFSKNKEVKSVVDLYFESTNKTLHLFNIVEKYVAKAKTTTFNIRLAIRQFERESRDTDFGGNNKYAGTLEKLNKVKAMGDPFGDEFTTQYKAIFDEHLMLLNKSRDMQLELEKKHKNDKKSRRLGYILFAAALFSVLAIWIYVGPVSLVVAAKVSIGVAKPSIRPLWKWVTEMLEDSEIAYKKLTGLFQSMDKNAKLNIESAETIKSLVETLITRIKPILETVDDAVEQREEETVKLVMQEIIKDVESFADKIEEVGTNVARCTKVVAEGRVDVLEHIRNLA